MKSSYAKIRSPFHNSDNDCLSALECEQLVLGCVHEVNGLDAREMVVFIPTCGELQELVRYYAQRIIQIESGWSLRGSCDLRETYMHEYACRRLSRMAQLLGKSVAQEILEEVRELSGARHFLLCWDLYLCNSREQRDAARLVMMDYYRARKEKSDPGARQKPASMDRASAPRLVQRNHTEGKWPQAPASGAISGS